MSRSHWCTPSWMVSFLPNGRIAYPLNDLIAHEPGETCVCGPLVKPVPIDDGSIEWHVTHHSLDGREARSHG